MEGTVNRGRTHAICMETQGRGEHVFVVPRVRHLSGDRLQNLCTLQRLWPRGLNGPGANSLSLRQQASAQLEGYDRHPEEGKTDSVVHGLQGRVHARG